MTKKSNLKLVGSSEQFLTNSTSFVLENLTPDTKYVFHLSAFIAEVEGK